MLVDSLDTRERIYADVMAASDDGTKPLSRDWLLNYELDGEALPLIDAQGRGIRNPRPWQHTLSITTTENGRYPDREVTPGVWQYPYCIDKHGNVDPSNKKLQNATTDLVPILYFYKPMPHTYLPVGLVTPFRDNARDHEFTIALTVPGSVVANSESVIERDWVRRAVEVRLHQPRFRAIVLDAYSDQCAVCGLPEASLLDAAHIRCDKDPDGQPVVQNGLALCAIHHRAYDSYAIGIDEDLGLHVRPSLMDISDGPVWEQGLLALDGGTLSVVPTSAKRPDPHRLGLTFKDFLSAAS